MDRSPGVRYVRAHPFDENGPLRIRRFADRPRSLARRGGQPTRTRFGGQENPTFRWHSVINCTHTVSTRQQAGSGSRAFASPPPRPSR